MSSVIRSILQVEADALGKLSIFPRDTASMAEPVAKAQDSLMLLPSKVWWNHTGGLALLDSVPQRFGGNVSLGNKNLTGGVLTFLKEQTIPNTSEVPPAQ